MAQEKTFAQLRAEAIIEHKGDDAALIKALNTLYAGKSSKELLDTLSNTQRWATIHVAEYLFKDTTEGFGALTITSQNNVVVAIPLVGGEIIAARHLPTTKAPEKVRGIKIVDFQKSLFKDKDGNIVGQTTKVVSEWLV